MRFLYNILTIVALLLYLSSKYIKSYMNTHIILNFENNPSVFRIVQKMKVTLVLALILVAVIVFSTYGVVDGSYQSEGLSMIMPAKSTLKMYNNEQMVG